MKTEQTELQRRWIRFREAMEDAGLDLLVLTARENFEYLTGYVVDHPWLSRSRCLVAIARLTGDPLVVVPEILASDVLASSPVRDVVSSDPNAGGAVDRVLGIVKQAAGGLSGRLPRVGLELGTEQRLNLPINEYQSLTAWDGAEWVDAAGLIWGLRMTKSEAELAHLRRVSSMTAAAFERMFEHVRAGASESELGQRFKQGLVEAGADAPWFVMITSGRDQYHRVFGRPRDRRLVTGDMLWCDAGATYSGYWSDYDRAAVIGGPSTHQAGLWSTIEGVTMNLCEMVRPGIRISRIAEECESLFEKHGLPRLSGRLGHGIGLSPTEPPDVAVYDHTILQPGMVFSIEPAFVDGTGMYQTEVYVAVTDRGHELLPHPDRALRTL